MVYVCVRACVRARMYTCRERERWRRGKKMRNKQKERKKGGGEGYKGVAERRSK